MKIELKNIKYFAAGSEETPCYNADIYVDNVKAMYVSNSGRGGADMAHLHEGFTYQDKENVDNYISEHMPTYTFERYDSKDTAARKQDLEYWCQTELYKFVDSRDLKRKLRTNILVLLKSTDKHLRKMTVNANNYATQLGFIKEEYPKAIILNELDFDKALKLYSDIS